MSSDEVADQLNQTIKLLEQEIDQKYAELGLAGSDLLPEPMEFELGNPGHMSSSTGDIGQTLGGAHVPTFICTPTLGVPVTTARVDFSLPRPMQSVSQRRHVNSSGNFGGSNAGGSSEVDFLDTIPHKPVVQPGPQGQVELFRAQLRARTRRKGES